MTERFPIRLQRSLRPILVLFGARSANSYVELEDDRIVARFGFFGTATPLANVDHWDITGPYRWWRAAGVRASAGKPELTFGGSSHGGLCLHLREPVRIARLGVRDLYVTVDDLAGLGAALVARGIPGTDLRRPS